MGTRAIYFLKIFLVLAFATWLADVLRHTASPRLVWGALVGQWQHADARWLWAALLLMPVNWAAEAKKWSILLGGASAVSFWCCLRSVLGGVSSSVFTPNRIGEVAGRLLLLPPALRWPAAAAQGIGMMSGLWVVLAAGSMGMWILWVVYFSPSLHWAVMAGMLGGAVLAALLWGYFGLARADFRRSPLVRCLRSWLTGAYEAAMEHWPRLCPALVWGKRQAAALCAGVVGCLSGRLPVVLAQALGWAAFRYAVYSVQYFCLLHFMGIPVGVVEGFAGIFTLFLLQAGLLLPPVLGLLARGGLAVHIWAFWGATEISSLAATGLLWIINLILPSLVGTFFLLSVNSDKPHHYHPAHD